MNLLLGRIGIFDIVRLSHFQDRIAVELLLYSFLKGKDRELVVTLTPADRNGNLLGPGYGSQLLFLLDDEVQGTVRDRLDGSYEIRVQPEVVTATQQRTKTQPAAALWIAGERIFSGSLPRLLETSKG